MKYIIREITEKDNKEIENHSKALLCFAGKGRVIL